jgi:hypothetical protein
MINTKTIRNNTVTALLGQTAAGNNVIAAKITPTMVANLPVVCVFTPSSQSEGLDHRNPAFRRAVSLQIEVAAAATSGWADVVDDIVYDIKTTLFTDATWLADMANIASYTEEQTLEADGEMPIAMSTLTINLELVECENANR